MINCFSSPDNYFNLLSSLFVLLNVGPDKKVNDGLFFFILI